MDDQIQPGVAPTMSPPELSEGELSEISIDDSSSTPERARVRLQNVRLDLQTAAREGNWKAAKKIIDENGDLDPKSMRLNGQGMTALHVAASSGRTELVKEMVKILNAEELKQKDQNGRNVLHYVAMASGLSAAKAIVDKQRKLVNKKESFGHTPLFYAARWRHPSKAKEMLEFLYTVTSDDVYVVRKTAPSLIVAVTASGCYDVVLKILEKHPRLAVKANDNRWSILYLLASQPSAFDTRKEVSVWKKTFCPWMNSTASEKENDATDLVHFVCKELRKQENSFVMEYFMPANLPAILQLATKNGVFKLVELCLKYFPDLIWYTSRRGKLLLHVAVKHRRVELFNHIIELIGNNTGSYAAVEVAGEGNILHLAALLAPTPQLHSVAGPAFQLQRELEWFKAVEELVYKEQMDALNPEGKKPIDSFYAKHKDLITEAKEWIKVTSNSCMVVAALVATVAFASMITVPGGNDSGTGKPVLSKTAVFIVFSISNACSMISSAIALLMFLSLQTSRFTTEDFLATLPKNLLRGLLSLFFAVAAMMLSFGTAIGMALQTRLNWAYIPITIVACIPTIIFTRLQLPLLFQTLGVTSGPVLYTKPRNPNKYSLLVGV